jgi:hypothetical protein
MTKQEIRLINSMGNVWNKFLQLPKQHPSDQQEFQFHIHALQNIVASREGYRQLKKKKK